MANFTKTHWTLMLINVCIVIFMFIFIGIKWSSLPNEIPTAYIGDKIYSTKKGIVFVIPGIAVLLIAVFSVLNFIPSHYWKYYSGKKLPMDQESQPAIDQKITLQNANMKLIRTICSCLITVLVVINIILCYILYCMIYVKVISAFMVIIFVIIILIILLIFFGLIYKQIKN